MLRAHYRQPIDWTFNSLDESHKILWDWYGDLEGLQSENRVSIDAIHYLCDDLNTSQLIAELHSLRRKREFQSLLSTLQFLGFSGDKSKLARTRVLLVQNNTFDVATQVVRENLRRQTEVIAQIGSEVMNPPLPLIAEQIDQLIAKRDEARKAKDFKEADRIRDELATLGIRLKDNPDGTSTPEIAR
jgi:cysteinyl-tRNA synthetase